MPESDSSASPPRGKRKQRMILQATPRAVGNALDYRPTVTRQGIKRAPGRYCGRCGRKVSACGCES